MECCVFLRIGKRDAFDCLENAELLTQYPIIDQKPLRWCCDSHRLEFEFTKDAVERTKLDQACSIVRSAVEKADTNGTRVLARATLRCIILHHMELYNMAYPQELVEKMLDNSKATWKDVVISKEWARVGDNAVKYDDIPYATYNTESFIRLLGEALCDGDTISKYLVVRSEIRKDTVS